MLAQRGNVTQLRKCSPNAELWYDLWTPNKLCVGTTSCHVIYLQQRHLKTSFSHLSLWHVGDANARFCQETPLLTEISPSWNAFANSCLFYQDFSMQMYSLREKILFFKYAIYFPTYVFAEPANKVLFKSCILEWGTLSLHPFSYVFIAV